MSEMADPKPFESIPKEVPSVAVETSDSKPEMMVIRRRRRRRSRGGRVKVDPRYRRLHAALIVLVVFLLIVSVTGDFFRDLFVSLRQHVGVVFHGMHQVRLEIVFLVLALLILIYLTPGVEPYVFKLLGLKRTDD